MLRIDKRAAEEALHKLPLAAGTRSFADWWLSQFARDGLPISDAAGQSITGHLAESSLLCEVGPRQSVMCRVSGDKINRVLGMSLAGRDLLTFIAPADRAVRHSRYEIVALGGMLFSYRGLLADDGSQYRIQELLFPYPGQRVTPIEPDSALTILYLDSYSIKPGSHLLVSQGALNLAEECVFVDLRPLATSLIE